MEGSTSKRPLENPEENSNPSKKVRKAYSLEFKRNVLDEVKSSYPNSFLTFVVF